MISLKNTLEAIKEKLSGHDASIKALSVDYIVEQGTSGIWTYRKWNSGIAECWGRKTWSSPVAVTTSWGGICESSSQSNIEYPSNLFIESPVLTMFGTTATKGALLAIEVEGDYADKIPKYWFTRGASGNPVPVVSIHAIGRWK